MSLWLTYLPMVVEVRSPLREHSLQALTNGGMSCLSLSPIEHWSLEIQWSSINHVFKREVEIYLYGSGWTSLNLAYLEITVEEVIKFFENGFFNMPCPFSVDMGWTWFVFPTMIYPSELVKIRCLYFPRRTYWGRLWWHFYTKSSET